MLIGRWCFVSQDDSIRAQHAAAELTASACSFVLLLQADHRCQDDETPVGDGTTPDSAMSKVKPSLLKTMHGCLFMIHVTIG